MDFGQDEDEDDFDPLKPSNLSTRTKAASTTPAQQQENGDVINQLSSLDLSSDLKPLVSEDQPTMPSLSEILQPIQTAPPTMSQPQLPFSSQPPPTYASGVTTMQMPAGSMVGMQPLAYVPAHAYGMAPGPAPGMMVNQQVSHQDLYYGNYCLVAMEILCLSEVFIIFLTFRGFQ